MSIDVRLRHAFGAFTLDVAFAVERPGVTALFGASEMKLFGVLPSGGGSGASSVRRHPSP